MRSQIRKHSLFLLQVYQPRPPPQARYEGHDGLADLQTSFLGRPSRGHQEQSASRDNQTPLNSKTKTPGTNLRYVHIRPRLYSFLCYQMNEGLYTYLCMSLKEIVFLLMNFLCRAVHRKRRHHHHHHYQGSDIHLVTKRESQDDSMIASRVQQLCKALQQHNESNPK